MRAHAITTKARVGGRGRTKRAIVPSGILTLSLAVVLLAATASTASAHRGVRMSLDGPTSVGFGDREVGTTSPAQAFTLRVGCRPTGSGCEAGSRKPRISVPGDYAQTNDCPQTMLSGQSCTINVTFAPASTGPKTGTLRTGRTACVKKANSPQHHDPSCEAPTATLNGNGVSTPTPPTPPLTLDALAHQDGVSPLKLYAFTNHDSTLVVRGRKLKKTKKTTKPLAGDGVAGYRAVIRVKPKHPGRLDRPGWNTAKIKVAATDEFGQRATDEFEKRVYLYSRPRDRQPAALAVAKETIKVKTSVKLSFSAGSTDPADDTFKGRVRAKKGCQKGRKVTLTHGVNKLASDQSNNRGEYKIIGSYLGGDGLRAVARERKITKNNGDKIVCKTGRSKKITLR